MLDIDDLIDAGVVLLDEQIDFFQHPEGRLAVVVCGVPDPDRLYIAGPHQAGETLYQQAWYGEPADDRDMQAVVLPLVLEGGDQDDLQRIVLEHEGDLYANFPYVLGNICSNDATCIWLDDATPLYAAVWDIWPIDRYEEHIWTDAMNNSILRSAIPAMFQFFDTYTNGTEHELVDDDLEDEDWELLERLRHLEKNYQGHAEQDDELAGIIARREEIRLEKGSIGQRIMGQWEEQMTHPVNGDIDAQMPPVDLPPEQAAIWRSLQSLSWRNWATLEKQDPSGRDALGDSLFRQSNRRLCPWY